MKSRENRQMSVHPGEALAEEFMEPLGLSQNRVAVAIGVPPRRINEIVHGKRGITADTAFHLGRYFGTSPESWMNLQSRYELEVVQESIAEELLTSTPLELATA